MTELSPPDRRDPQSHQYEDILERLDQLKRELDQALQNEWVANERSRIAQELHDRVAQTLFSIGLTADWLLTHLDRDRHLQPDLQRLKQMSATGMRQVREVIFSLSSAPVDSAHFKPAVRLLLNDLAQAGIVGDLQTWGDLHLLPPELTDGLYQVVREALVNARRHSGAASVLVSLRVEPDRVTAVIQDDGRGLPDGVLETYRENGAHLGLLSMERRIQRLGGSLELTAGDECGLIVKADIPLKGVLGHAEPDSHSDRR